MSKKMQVWKMKLLLVILSQGLFWTAAGGAVRANELVLISGGKAHMVIAYGDQSTHQERDAAKRLENFLARMTGVSVDIVTVSKAPAGVGRILLGPGAAKTVGIDIAQTYPGGERVIVKRVGKDLVIAGNDAQVYQGTRHAVDMFLAELGSECFSADPNWHVVPKTDKIAIGDIDIDTSPDFGYRSLFFFTHPSGDLSHPDFDRGSWGLGGTLVHMPHNYENIVPYSLLEEHPEYFALVNGVRTGRGAQICFSNPEVVARAVRAARSHFDNNPAQLMFSLSANDTAGFCECPGCKKLGENPAGQTLSFCNAVVRELRKTHPDKSVATIAYLATMEAPKRVKSGPGVVVFVVNQSCRAHSLDNEACPSKKPYKENFQAWRATGAEVTGIYEYYMTAWGGYKHVPAFLGDAALRDLRYYKANGITGVYCEGAAFATIEDSPIQWPLHYVMAKGLWDTDLTAEQILRPACQKLFGAAAEPMLAFYMECAKALEANPNHGAMWGIPHASLTYTPEVLKTIRGLLGQAMQMGAEESPEVIGRIFDVVECWNRTEDRFVEDKIKQQYPKYLKNVLNGQPGVELIPQNLINTPTVAKTAIPSGDCAFTLFFVGTVKKFDGSSVLMGWGNGQGVSQLSAIEIQGDRIDWATGWGEDAVTAAGSFKDYFDRPVVICIRKRPGPINKTTSIWLDGKEIPLTEKSSSRTPEIRKTGVRIGGTDMIVGEVILYNRALPDAVADGVGSYLAEKFRLHTAYSGGDKAVMPDKLSGLCAWFKVAMPERPKTAAAAEVHKDNFNSYADDAQLRADLGKLKWSKAVLGGGDQQLKVVGGVVQRQTAGPWSRGAFATSPLHQGQAYARVQADVKYSAYNNAQHAGVFLNATKWNRGEIGKYGSKNLYKASIDTEGFFTLVGNSDRSGKGFSSGRRSPSTPFEFDKWYTLILEAHYAAGKVTLDVTIKRTSDGKVMGTYSYVDTDVLLSGGAAGMHMYDSSTSALRLDNFELEYRHRADRD